MALAVLAERIACGYTPHRSRPSQVSSFSYHPLSLTPSASITGKHLDFNIQQGRRLPPMRRNRSEKGQIRPLNKSPRSFNSPPTLAVAYCTRGPPEPNRQAFVSSYPERLVQLPAGGFWSDAGVGSRRAEPVSVSRPLPPPPDGKHCSQTQGE